MSTRDTRDFDTDVKNHTRDFDNSITINQYMNFISTKVRKVAIIFLNKILRSLVEQPRSHFGPCGPCKVAMSDY